MKKRIKIGWEGKYGQGGLAEKLIRSRKLALRGLNRLRKKADFGRGMVRTSLRG
jgi:hypothetical protein